MQQSELLPCKFIQGYRFWYQSKARVDIPISTVWSAGNVTVITRNLPSSLNYAYVKVTENYP